MDQSRSAVGAGGRSHLGVGSNAKGELSFPGTVELPGSVKGRVDAAEIVIEDTGVVEGEVHAARITIKGQFDGKVVGDTVTLHTSARVTGEITYETLTIEIGAEVEGKCIPRATAKVPAPTDQESGSAKE